MEFEAVSVELDMRREDIKELAEMVATVYRGNEPSAEKYVEILKRYKLTVNDEGYVVDQKEENGDLSQD